MRKWLRSRFTHNRWVFHTALFPILGGPMRGLRWSCVSGGKLLRVLRGTYEVKQTQLVWQSLGAGDTFIDVGAHHGYYTMLASRAVGSNGMVMAFEPDPRNAFLLRGHVHANALSNTCVVESAVANHQGMVLFAAGTGTGTGAISQKGTLPVQVTTLDHELLSRKLVPTHIKIDVEGAEVDVLKGAKEVLSRYRPTLFLSTHGARVKAACCHLLREMGYCLAPIDGEDFTESTELYCQHVEQLERKAA